MMNKKLIALFVAISAISSISARCYRDGSCDDGLVRRTGSAAGNVVEGTGEVAGGAVRGTGEVADDLTGGLLGRVFTGKDRRQDRRERRQQRADYYNDYD